MSQKQPDPNSLSKLLLFCFNKLGSRKTHLGFQMHSSVLEILALVFQTTGDLFILNMFKLFCRCIALIDKILIQTFLGVVLLGLAQRVINYYCIARQNHSSFTEGLLLMCFFAGPDTCRRWWTAGDSEALLCDKKWDDCKQGMGKKWFQVFLKYNLNNIEWGQ